MSDKLSIRDSYRDMDFRPMRAAAKYGKNMDFASFSRTQHGQDAHVTTNIFSKGFLGVCLDGLGASAVAFLFAARAHT